MQAKTKESVCKFLATKHVNIRGTLVLQVVLF